MPTSTPRPVRLLLSLLALATVASALPAPDAWRESRLVDLRPTQEMDIGVRRIRWATDTNKNGFIDMEECLVRDPSTQLWSQMDTNGYENLVRWRLAMEMEPTPSYIYQTQNGRDYRVFVDAPSALKTTDKRPAVIFFNGGSWDVGWQGVFYPFAEYFARRGMVCFRVDYRVGYRDGAAPETNSLRAARDGRAALRWIRTNAARFGVDPDRLITVGESAGGQVAIASALASNLDGTQPDPALAPYVKAIVAAYPISDTSDARVSPYDLLSASTPPLYVTWGTADPFAPSLQDFVSRAQSVGLSPSVYIEQDASHGYILSANYQSDAITRIDTFLTGRGLLAAGTATLPALTATRYQNGLIEAARFTTAAALRATSPNASGVTVLQRAGTSVVEIGYNLAVPGLPSAYVSMRVSRDGGATFSDVVPAGIQPGSDYGAGVKASLGKRIVWDSSLQGWGNITYTAAQIELTATAVGGMVWIPHGTYTQGSPATELGRTATVENQRQVSLTQSILVQATEVPWTQWNEVRSWALGNGYTDLAAGLKGERADANNTDLDPVTFVSWYDALKWLNARSEKEGFMPVYTTANGQVYRTGDIVPKVVASANGYRLPTEAEWEYVARAGSTSAFYSGPISYTGTSPLDPNLDLIGWYGGNSGSRIRPVGGKVPNAWGLYDTAANAWEWCWDYYGTYSTGSDIRDPAGPDTGTNRVKRGGSWGAGAANARSAYRNNEAPTSRVWSNNFRPVRTSGMVRIPAGSFIQGSPIDELGRMKNETQRAVTLTKPFFLQSTEVTWRQWNHVRAWALTNGYPDLPPGQRGHAASGADADDHPVTLVSWHDAVKWLNAWSEKEGLTPVYLVGTNPAVVYRSGESTPTVTTTANGYRLPTEAEWEYAARAGSSTALPNGALTGIISDTNLDAIAWYANTSPTGTKPVAFDRSKAANGAGKGANAWGLYDMLGNVAEWCEDWFVYSTDTAAVIDPRGPSTGGRRVDRGGSWNDNAGRCRPAMRISYTTPTRAPTHGFRAARNVN